MGGVTVFSGPERRRRWTDVEAAADPGHEQHNDVIRCAGGGSFDPIAVDTAAIDKALDTLARRWNRAKG